MNLNTSVVVATWPDRKEVAENWGDALNPVLVGGLSGLPVVNARHVHRWEDRPVLRAIGSSLAAAGPQDVIWGMGFISQACAPKHAPGQILAVRGPRTQRRLVELGLPSPDIVGDPAILYPLLYWPQVEQRHDVGIIQHFREYRTLPPVSLPEGTSAIEIDIRSGLREVVAAVLSCRHIVSSSLHGVICAHAYGIPAQWLKASSLPLGDDFKFRDYFESIGHPDADPAIPGPAGAFIPSSSPDRPRSLIDGEQLLGAFPFITRERRAHFQRRIRALRSAGRKGTIFNLF